MLRLPFLKSLYCLVLLTTSSSEVLATQQPPATDYAKEAFVVNSTASHVRFTDSGTSVRTQATSIKMLSEAGVKAWSVLSFPFAADNERVDIHFIRVQKPDGSVVATPAANILELPSEVTRAAPMYSDLKQKQVPVKALSVGDTLEFEAAYVEDKPLVPGQFWYVHNFSRGFVVLKESLEIRFPHDRQPKIASSEIKPIITHESAEDVYTWTTSHTAPTTSEGSDAVDPKDGATPEPDEPDKKPSVQLSTFSSWQQVGEWYAKLAQPQAKVTPEIQAQADKLVQSIPAGPGQTEARIQAIYDFVSLKIHYIGLSFGVGRYQPHTAAEVLDNSYGDCKDKHTLLAALLKAENIEAWPVLIDSSRKLDEDVPSPAQFDHLITIIPQGKQYLWLDSTPEVAPFGMLLWPLRDKLALVIPPMTVSEAPDAVPAAFLLKTPATPPFSPQDALVMRGALDSTGTFKGHGELTLRGDSEVIYRTLFHASARAKWQDVMQQVSYGLGFGGDVSNVEIGDPELTKTPFHMAWDYQRKKYGDWDNRQIIPPTGGIPIPNIREDKKPKSPVQLGAPTTTVFTGELTLPPDSSMEPPSNVDIKTPFAEYHAKYSVLNGKFLSERKITIFQKEIPIADWEKYVAFQKQINEDYNHMTTVSTFGPTAVAAVPESKDLSDVAELIQTAAQSCQAQELIQCEDTLDKARKLNPHQTNLNSAYGSLYMSQGKMDQGIEAFRTELKEHPDNYRVARWFGQMLTRTHRDEDALEVYRNLLKSIPDDIDANSEAARILVTREDWKEAQPILDKTVQLRPGSYQVQLWYGLACMHNGQEDKAFDALNTASMETSDPATLATIASALAVTSKGVKRASELAQSAVKLMEIQTGSIELGSITAAQLKLMNDLSRVWSSMSLTSLETGALDLSARYAQSAWLLSQDPIAGDRLSLVYEKQGKLALALETEKLAKAHPYPAVPGIDGRITALEKRLGTATSHSEYNASKLQDLRIIHLSRDKSISASADFLVMFSHGKVTDVKMLGGDPRIESYAASLKSAHFDLPFPDDGPEHVVRQGTLSCSIYDTKCMFMMMLPQDATINSRVGSSVPFNRPTVIHLDQH